MLDKNQITPAFESKYIKVYDLEYAPGKHYLDATRRDIDNLTVTKSDEAFKLMLPDAVTCIVILHVADEEPKLLLSREYRYPAGQFLLSPPAGLIDPEDMNKENPLIETAAREIFEETGIQVNYDNGDSIAVINPLVFSTPGMTDESNGLVLAQIHLDNLDCLNQNGCVGSELFDGFRLVDKEEARNLIKVGSDEYGIFYSGYTWMALMYFISDLY